MVFVHSRKDTYKTALILKDMAQENSELSHFSPREDPNFEQLKKEMGRARSKELKELYPNGFTIHHAGMLRSDRNLVEKASFLFAPSSPFLFFSNNCLIIHSFSPKVY